MDQKDIGHTIFQETHTRRGKSIDLVRGTSIEFPPHRRFVPDEYRFRIYAIDGSIRNRSRDRIGNLLTRPFVVQKILVGVRRFCPLNFGLSGFQLVE